MLLSGQYIDMSRSFSRLGHRPGDVPISKEMGYQSIEYLTLHGLSIELNINKNHALL
jgi:hypothetical protein